MAEKVSYSAVINELYNGILTFAISAYQMHCQEMDREEALEKVRKYLIDLAAQLNAQSSVHDL